MAEGTDDRDNAPSPDSKCSICLSRILNKCFTDRCFHMFCFSCLLEWSKRNAVCPLCKQSFTQIFHNIRSISKYDIYDVTSHPSYLPSFSSVNFITSLNRLSMAGHISPLNSTLFTPEENEFVITISPDSRFTDAHMSAPRDVASGQLDMLSHPFSWSATELTHLRSHLSSVERAAAMRMWLRTELLKISRLVTRIKASNIRSSVDRMMMEMRKELHTSSSFVTAMSFHIGTEYTKLFLMRLKNYLNSHHNTEIHGDDLTSLVESTSINALLDNFHDNSNSSGGSLVVDSDIEITNICRDNIVGSHRHTSSSTHSKHFIDGLIHSTNAQTPCTFSLVVSIPQPSNHATTSTSSTRPATREPAVDDSKAPICVSSGDDDDDDDVIALPQVLKSSRKRVYSLTSEEEGEEKGATTSRAPRRKEVKSSILPRTLVLRSKGVKEEVAGKGEGEKGGGKQKFKKHHSGHKNLLRRQEWHDEDCKDRLNRLTGRLIAFERLFPHKTPSQIIKQRSSSLLLPDGDLQMHSSDHDTEMSMSTTSKTASTRISESGAPSTSTPLISSTSHVSSTSHTPLQISSSPHISSIPLHTSPSPLQTSSFSHTITSSFLHTTSPPHTSSHTTSSPPHTALHTSLLHITPHHTTPLHTTSSPSHTATTLFSLTSSFLHTTSSLLQSTTPLFQQTTLPHHHIPPPSHRTFPPPHHTPPLHHTPPSPPLLHHTSPHHTISLLSPSHHTSSLPLSIHYTSSPPHLHLSPSSSRTTTQSVIDFSKSKLTRQHDVSHLDLVMRDVRHDDAKNDVETISLLSEESEGAERGQCEVVESDSDVEEIAV